MAGISAGDAEKYPYPEVGETQTASSSEDDYGSWSPRSPLVFSVHPGVREGSLHLQPCTFDEYLSISSAHGRYDLVGGILVALPMPDGQHDRAIMYLQTLFGERKRRDRFRGTEFANCCAVPNATIGISLREYRISDLSIGVYQPSPDNVSFPVEHPPLIVVEVTSLNRSNDLIAKKKAYSKAKVREYLIIDRDKRRKGTNSPEKCVHHGVLHEGEYQWKSYSEGSVFKSCWFGSVSASDLCAPESPSKIVAANAAKERKALADAETRAKAAAAEAKKAKDKAKRTRKRAELAGVVFSDSSPLVSPSESPVKR